jgi:phosphoglycolate phosphatase
MRVCFFDIDGTLITTLGAGQRAFADVFRDLWGVDKLAGNISFAGRSDRAIAFDLFRAHGVPDTLDNWHTFRDAYVSRLGEVLPQCEGTVLPGVELLISSLQQTSLVHVGLLTGNVIAGAEAKLSHYNLWHHFLFGGYGDEHTDRCDIAATALEAARRHAASTNGVKERFAVIGDTVHDIRCARSIGAYAVAVPTGLTPIDELRAAKPDLAVETLEDCQQLVDWLTED